MWRYAHKCLSLVVRIHEEKWCHKVWWHSRLLIELLGRPALFALWELSDLELARLISCVGQFVYALLNLRVTLVHHKF
jgi:hypothetical protein